jgi:hypothetical protein
MIEVLKQTVKALELVSTEFVCDGAHHAKKDRHELGEPCPIVERYEEAMQAGKQTIAELESQEPVACQYCHNSATLGAVYFDQNCVGCVKRMSHPPQRTWVGLTNDEIAGEFYKFEAAGAWYQFAKAIEAKFKELNT